MHRCLFYLSYKTVGLLQFGLSEKIPPKHRASGALVVPGVGISMNRELNKTQEKMQKCKVLGRKHTGRRKEGRKQGMERVVLLWQGPTLGVSGCLAVCCDGGPSHPLIGPGGWF